MLCIILLVFASPCCSLRPKSLARVLSRVARVANALLLCVAVAALELPVTAAVIASDEADRAWEMRSERLLVAPATMHSSSSKVSLMPY
jgi:hypothetical protein